MIQFHSLRTLDMKKLIVILIKHLIVVLVHGQFHFMPHESAQTPEGELRTCSTSLSEETAL